MERTARRIFISDCEGPITKNDNAAELSEAFIPHGDQFFKKISLYDDYLAEVVRRQDYKAGDTLRLILPFFKAFGLDNRSMNKFSRRNIELIPQADCMLHDVQDVMPAYIVSTSYTAYIKAVCDAVGFPFRNTFATDVDLDAFLLSAGEKAALKEIHKRIMELPDFSVSASASTLNDLDDTTQQVVQELDEIFWNVLPAMGIYEIVEETTCVGGREKARAIESIAEDEDSALRDVFYVGDSITDVEAFRLVKGAGGMALSFNGNDWAVKEASFAVTARSALPIGWLASMFLNLGSQGFEDLECSAVTQENCERISSTSSRVRKDVRTEKIGGLG
jgi:energy-converting hydrogenase A subunit R